MDAAPHDQSNRPRLIDINPVLLSNLELEVMLNIPYDSLSRPRLLQLATLTGQHFAETGRYPGWGAQIDILRDVDEWLHGVLVSIADEEILSRRKRRRGGILSVNSGVCEGRPINMYGQQEDYRWRSFATHLRTYSAVDKKQRSGGCRGDVVVDGRQRTWIGRSHTSTGNGATWTGRAGANNCVTFNLISPQSRRISEHHDMKLRHIALRGLTRYSDADKLQNEIVKAFLAAKADPSLPKPPPTIITAQFHPVYTTGRRDFGQLTDADKSFLSDGGRADVFEALRGGQTTYHGPGQLTAYPLLDLRTHKLGTRDYICLLEKSIIAICAKYGVRAKTTENTGVWVTDDKKIAAVGVHLRRYISSHGIGFNIDKRVDWGFQRIVACGLEGKLTTHLEAEGAGSIEVEQMGREFASEIAHRLSGVDGVTELDQAIGL